MKYMLNDICFFVDEKIFLRKLTKDTYISTENMLPNRGGIVAASTLPSLSQIQSFKVGDVLVSNIRPYFKKYGRLSLMVDVQMMYWFLERTKVVIQHSFTML